MIRRHFLASLSSVVLASLVKVWNWIAPPTTYDLIFDGGMIRYTVIGGRLHASYNGKRLIEAASKYADWQRFTLSEPGCIVETRARYVAEDDSVDVDYFAIYEPDRMETGWPSSPPEHLAELDRMMRSLFGKVEAQAKLRQGHFA
jgi:hypothetical protein